MSTQQTCIAHLCSDDARKQIQLSERLLNDAIVHADISRSFEEYLDIVERFYADEIVLTGEATGQVVRGKDAVRSLVASFLIPLHVMSEIEGLRVIVLSQPIAGDNLDETHAAWAVELVGITGKTCTLKWRSQRKWEGGRVVYEYHYDEQQIGGPLTAGDLNFNPGAASA